MTPSRPVTVWDEEVGSPPNEWDQQGAEPKRERDFFHEFNTEKHILEGTSITLRPDAISLDYLTAVTPGPEILGLADTAYARPWKVRATATDVFLARGDGPAYDAETLLFSYVGAPIVEIDCAFEQAGRPVVVASRATGAGGAHEVWIYFFDPTIPDFVFTNFGAGRTPRCLLDEPLDAAISDVLVFYVADAVGATGTLCYRQQRDRYAVQYTTPVVGSGRLEQTRLPAISNLFLEDVIKGLNSRVVALLSVRTRGRYRFTHLVSALYPIALREPDTFTEGLSLIDGEMLLLLIEVGPPDEAKPFRNEVESWVEGLAPQSGTLLAPLILYTSDIEQFHEGLAPQSGQLPVVVVVHTLFDLEQFHEGLAPQSGTIVAVVIVHTLFDLEQFHEGLTPISGTLAP